MTDPKTIPERLDAAENGEQFKNVLLDLFSALEEARAETDD